MDLFAVWIALFQVVFTFFLGFLTMISRRNLDKDLLKKAYGDEHKKIGVRPAWMGYPDMGCGKYADVIPYKNWFSWNCAIRAHQNAVENNAVSVFSILACWYFNPQIATLVGLGVLASRILYTLVYLLSPTRIVLASRLNTAFITGGLVFSLAKTFSF